MLDKELTTTEAFHLAVNKHQEGDLAAADMLYTAILQAHPMHSDANHNLGLIAVRLGKHEKAKELFSTALQTNKSHSQYWLSFIEVCLSTDGIKMALEQLKNAESEIGYFTRARQLLAKACLQENQITYAIDLAGSLYETCSEDDKTSILFADCLNANKEYDKAIQVIEKVLTRGNESADLWNNLGANKKAIGDKAGALSCFARALVIDKKHTVAGSNLGITLEGQLLHTWEEHVPQALELLVSANDYCNPQQVHNAVISILSKDRILAEVLGNFLESGEFDIQSINHLDKNTLLLAFISSCPVCNLDFELLFSEIRNQFLSAVSEEIKLPELSKFIVALSTQVYINEFVYYETPRETKLVEQLERKVSAAFEQRRSVDKNSLLALSLYRDFEGYDWKYYLYCFPELSELVRKRIEEPELEKRLSTTISCFEIDREVSNSVKQQYEAYPYPRWEKTGIQPYPLTLEEFCRIQRLRLPFPLPNNESPVVLVAGCGTGQQSIHAARAYADCKVTAIDLSLNSLSYAKRKTLEYGLTNIEYIRADLLDIAKVTHEKFDLIECSGVLHHMRAPEIGLKKLCESLKDGGILRLGLYSKPAREHLDKFQRNTLQNAQEIAAFRHQVVNSPNIRSEKIVRSPDFYSTSGFKDLVLHVQEHRYDLNEIERLIISSGLAFMGFDLKLAERSGIPESKIFDFESWRSLEASDENFFAGMYQFWCQKQS